MIVWIVPVLVKPTLDVLNVQISLETKEVIIMYGAYLMEFSITAMYNNGIVYYPGRPAGPGAMTVPFTYKFGEDGPKVEPDQLIIGVAASTNMRSGNFNVARVSQR
jgi:hypothetical protein